MTEITNEMWENASKIIADKLRYCQERDNPFAVVLELRVRILRDKYNNGDRSTELYNAIMELN